MTSAFLAHPPLSSSAIFAVSVVVWTATNLSPYSSRHSRPHAIFRWTTSVEEYLRVQPSIFLLKHPAAQRVLDQLVKYSGCPSFNTVRAQALMFATSHLSNPLQCLSSITLVKWLATSSKVCTFPCSRSSLPPAYTGPFTIPKSPVCCVVAHHSY